MDKPASRTLSALVDEMAKRYPERPAVSFREASVTFADFRRQAIGFAKALHADGVRKGDKVGILMGNRIEWLVVNFAIQYLGASMVALNTWYTPRELSYVLEHADVSTLITVDRYGRANFAALLDGFAPWGQTFPKLRRVVMLGDEPVPGAIDYYSFLERGLSVTDANIAASAAAVGPTDVAYLLYTSGSTAHPKGVMLRHDGLIDNMFDIGERLRFTSTDALFLPISLFWGLGCENMLLAAWTHGTHIVLQDQFDATEALALIEGHRCTAFCGTPNIVHAVFQHPERGRYDLSSLRKGAMSASPEAMRELIETAIPLACNCYGLTESYGFCTVSDADDPVERRCVSVGRPLPGTELRIVSPESGTILGPGEPGEIRLKGHVTPGYYKNPDADAESLDEHGFFRTGDLGVIDAQGFLLFKGRIKEMIKTGGMNVAPVEVEEVLRRHPGIREAFVTSLADPVRDQAVAAVIVLSAPDTLTQNDIIEYCRRELAAYKVPRHLLFTTMDRVPQTTTAKVHRQRLPDMFSIVE